ncbi:MAG: IS5 family transposase [Azospirillum brasilense]|nr:MAG: IS5 family transposase [Azospirillum brasilense]
MAKVLVPDDLWAAIEPLLPVERPKPKGRRPRLPDRAALTGIMFILTTGSPWERLPVKMGCGSGMTCWRRLRDWQAAGVWARLHRLLLDRLEAADRLRWDRAALDSRSVPGKKGGETTGPNPTDRGRPGSKHSLVTDAKGTPLGLIVAPANQHDSRLLEATLDAVPPVSGGKRGRPRRRPRKLHADKAYTGRPVRRALRRRGITPRIARKGIEDSRRLGRHRWVVERTFAWLARFRRLVVRYERRADIHLAFATLAAALICLRQIRRFC